MSDASTNDIRVVRIGGCPRSGSTLLELLVANRWGGIALGEVRHLFKRGILGNQRCACGSPFWECQWWAEVTLEAFGSRTAAEDVARHLLATNALAMWTFPGVRWKPQPDTKHRELFDAADRLLGACAARAEGRWLIDSSKDPVWFELIRRRADQSVTLHIVRDPKAVVHSNRKAVVRPEITDRKALMPQFGTMRTMRDYVIWNLATALGAKVDAYALIGYERLCAAPEPVLAGLTSVLGEPLPPHELGYHSVSGNPLRFRLTAPDDLVVEPAGEEWRRLPLVTRLIADALGAPSNLLTRFIVVLRRDRVRI